MSKNHARVFFDKEKFWLEDLRSTNGTWKVDKNAPHGRIPVQVEEISNDDEFQLGNTSIRFLLKM
jgi:pSer/pThr/pTyr-binding forkhead associated (FHA) protein